MRPVLALVLALGLAACASPAQEYEPDGDSYSSRLSYEREHPYARPGATLGLGAAYVNGDSTDLDGDANADGSVGLDVRGGYRFGAVFALELDGTWFTGRDVRVRSIVFQPKLYLYDGRVQPYVLGGFGPGHVEVGGRSDHVTVGRGGFGVDWYLSPERALYAEATFNAAGGILAETLHYTTFQVGILFRF